MPADTLSYDYDAVLLVGFGGPEGPDDVMPFLENVTRGRNIPRERLLAVKEHYMRFGGISPINEHCRELLGALSLELDERGIRVPLYWGNRNWTPMLADTVDAMTRDGVERVLAIATSAFSSYSGCRQYQGDIATAREAVAATGAVPPVIDKLRPFYDHPGFLEAVAELTGDALAELPAADRGAAHLLFTAHSIPVAMAATCDYAAQLEAAAAWVAGEVSAASHELVYQSRSGPPQVPWLEPDVTDHLEAVAARGVKDVVVVPIGFLSDHVEVLWDLDTEARERAEELGLRFTRAATVGSHPGFVAGLGELIAERVAGGGAASRVAGLPVVPDVCAPDCCAYTPRRPGAR